ncbi:heterokaryon incompatibility protein-domain-containing protein [Paraphoma chrysanthemicola]|nr:heterokaryon incompatibility protein-domain-containing protein [Paraphoma chrysanthemicola]
MNALRVPSSHTPEYPSTVRGSRSWSGTAESADTSTKATPRLNLLLISAEDTPYKSRRSAEWSISDEVTISQGDLLSAGVGNAKNEQHVHDEAQSGRTKYSSASQRTTKNGLIFPAQSKSDWRSSKSSKQSWDLELARAQLISGNSPSCRRMLGPPHLRTSYSWAYENAPAWSLSETAAGKIAHTRCLSFGKAATFEHQICSTCRPLDFLNLDMMDSSMLKNEGMELYTFIGLHRSMSHASCILCRAFASLLFTGSLSTQATYAPANGAIRVLPASHLSGMRKGMSSHGILGISLERNPVRWDAVARCTTEIQGLILPSATGVIAESAICHGQELQPYADFLRLRSMLSRCARDHQLCQTPAQKSPVNAKVIDCRTRRVVKLKEHYRYIALSYVWGLQSTTSIPHSDGSASTDLPTSLPRTIEDAISATIQLGLRYLWCDRYCIEQFHSADKRHQINQMASIYNRAVATICALGTDDNAGLPGVSSPRCVFPSLNIHGTTHFTVCPAPILLINHIFRSRWFTRGWTFQEALLSRRCIFFTPEQAHLVCCACSQHEGLLQATQSGERSNQLSWGSTATIFSTVLDAELRWFDDIRGNLKFSDYMQHYLQRRFTVDDDALPAFQGILSIVENQSYFGIIVLDTPFPRLNQEASASWRKLMGFAHGLSWQIDRIGQHPELRPSVPTWSWLSRMYTWPRLSSLNSELSSERNKYGLACVTAPLDASSYVAEIALPTSLGDVISMGDYLQDNEANRVVQSLGTCLIFRSLLSDVTLTPYKMTSIKAMSTWKCTFAMDDGRDYFAGADNASFDVSRSTYYGMQRDLAVLLLIERYLGDPSLCTFRWLILQEQKLQGQQCPRKWYNRVALFTFRESLKDEYHPMYDMVQSNMNKKGTVWVQ